MKDWKETRFGVDHRSLVESDARKAAEIENWLRGKTEKLWK